MAQEETFTIDQGADVAIELHLVNKDGSKKNLGNHSIAAKMKRNYTSDSDETTAFNAIVVSPPEDGVITISLSNTQTDLLRVGKYVYDVEMSYTDSDGDAIIERVLEGRIIVTPSVTR
jgi:hypothetical protein